MKQEVVTESSACASKMLVIISAEKAWTLVRRSVLYHIQLHLDVRLLCPTLGSTGICEVPRSVPKGQWHTGFSVYLQVHMGTCTWACEDGCSRRIAVIFRWKGYQAKKILYMFCVPCYTKTFVHVLVLSNSFCPAQQGQCSNLLLNLMSIAFKGPLLGSFHL